MIGFIVVLSIHYEGYHRPQRDEPLPVYLDRAEALEAAKKLNGRGQNGEVWEVTLP